MSALQELIRVYQGEALFRPSSIDRVMHCPGSVRLSAKAPKTGKQSVDAAKGTLAHKIIEAALKDERQPEEWIDRRVAIGEHVFWPNESFMRGVQIYLDLLAEHWHPGIQRFTEQNLSLHGSLIYQQNRGTIDTLYLDYQKRIISIWDYKNGTGVIVQKDAPQLQNYALLALDNYPVPGGWEKIELHVVQPNLPDFKHEPVEYEPFELIDSFAGKLISAMERAIEPDPELHSGTWCRWCPAKDAGICPLLQAEALNPMGGISEARYRASTALGPIPEAVFIGTPEQPFPMTTLPPGVVVLPDPSGLSEEQIDLVLTRKHLWDTWISAVQHRAVALLEYESAPFLRQHWKLGRRSGRRRWIDPGAALIALTQMGLEEEQTYTPRKLRTVKQIENLLTPEQRQRIKALYEIPLGKILLLPADSAKEALLPVMGPIEDDETDEAE